MTRKCVCGDIAASVGITERGVYDIVKDLSESGYLIKERHERPIVYHIQDGVSLPKQDSFTT
jgi:predicted transcriptional regulator